MINFVILKLHKYSILRGGMGIGWGSQPRHIGHGEAVTVPIAEIHDKITWRSKSDSIFQNYNF